MAEIQPNAGLSGAGPLTCKCKQNAPSRVCSRPLVELSRCAAGGKRRSVHGL